MKRINIKLNSTIMILKIINGMVWCNEMETWIPFAEWIEWEAQEFQHKISEKHFLDVTLNAGFPDLN